MLQAEGTYTATLRMKGFSGGNHLIFSGLGRAACWVDSRFSEALGIFNSLIRFMVDAALNIKRKKRGSISSTTNNELRSPGGRKKKEPEINLWTKVRSTWKET